MDERDVWAAPDGGSTAVGVRSLEVPTTLLLAQQVALIVLMWVSTGASAGLWLWFPEVAGGAEAEELPSLLLDVALVLAGLGLLLVELVGYPIWTLWHWRAGRNLWALERDVRYSPLAHAGWWWVPLANIVMPYLTMKELVVASRLPAEGEGAESVDGRENVRGLGWWWGTSLWGGLLTTQLALMDQASLKALRVDFQSTVLLTISAALYLRFVVRIRDGQRALVRVAQEQERDGP